MNNAQIIKEHRALIDMLKKSIENHPIPDDDYEKGFIAGMKEAIAEIKLAGKNLNSKASY